MSLMIVSAAKSKVTINGDEVQGLQSIDFKVRRRQADVEAVGLLERIGVESGQVIVNGTLRISSLHTLLDDILYAPNPQSFNMVASLNRNDRLIRTITFDECFLDDKSFELSANGVGLTSYNFTSTRVRET